MTHPLDTLDDDLRGCVRTQARPGFVEPMLATLTDQPFSDPRWIYEHKLDGVRAIAVRDGAEVALISRNEKRMDNAYPELVAALTAPRWDRFILDGEIVAFDAQGRTSFARLQGRIHLQDPDRARRTGIAVHLYLFDLLHLDGHDTRQLPLLARKRLLQTAFTLEDPLRFSPHLEEHGEDLYEEACRRGWEGLIAKRADSRYVSGRSRDWLKLKCVAQQEFVIGGFTDPRGGRRGFGALLVGYHGDGSLRYAGKVGTGYDERTLLELRATLDRIERAASPFVERVPEKGAHWVEPMLVCEVGFSEWTQDGKLRHPRFLGLRTDKDPLEVVREEPRR